MDFQPKNPMILDLEGCCGYDVKQAMDALRISSPLWRTQCFGLSQLGETSRDALAEVLFRMSLEQRTAKA